MKWITTTPPREWRLFCFFSKIPCNLPNRNCAVPEEGRSPWRRPAVPQECLLQAFREGFLYQSLAVPVVAAQQCCFGVAGQTTYHTYSCWARRVRSLIKSLPLTLDPLPTQGCVEFQYNLPKHVPLSPQCGVLHTFSKCSLSVISVIN